MPQQRKKINEKNILNKLFLLKSNSLNLMFLLLIYTLLLQIKSYPTSPLNIPQNTSYFGTEYVRLFKATNNNNNFFNSTPAQYSYPIALSRPYPNATSMHAVLTSFQIISNRNMGFTVVGITGTGNPLTSVNMKFKVFSITLFNMIGFTVFIIGAPFDQILTCAYMNITTINSWQSRNFPMPLYRRVETFIQSFNIYADNIYIVNYQNIQIQTYDTNQIYARLNCDSVCDDTALYHMDIIVMVYNLYDFNRTVTSYFGIHSFYASTPLYISKKNGPITLIQNTFFDNIDKIPVFGLDHRNKCIIGFQYIKGINRLDPFFKYDLGSPSINSVQNFVQNSITTAMGLQMLCFVNWECSASAPFRYHNSNQCHNCDDGYIIPGNIFVHSICTGEDFYKRRYQYSLTNFSVINICSFCNSCVSPLVPFNGKCQPCSIVFNNCNTCNSNSSCTLCNPYFYWNITTLVCAPCDDNCVSCTTARNCATCINQFVKIFDGTNNICKLIGCSQVLPGTFSRVCVSCNRLNSFKISNNKCRCEQGFQLTSDNLTCYEKCGDGLTVKHQCDDNNLINGDGCNNNCFIQTGYICNVTTYLTICKYQIRLQLKIQKITKNADNSATLVIKAINTDFPYPFGPNNFTQQNLYQFAKIFIVNPSDSSKNKLLKTNVIQSFSNEIHINLNYDKNIQNLPAMIVLDTSKTKYFCDQNQAILNFVLCGDNARLDILEGAQAFKGISIGILINVIITNLLFIIGLMSNKYIGLQAILTMQLTYYSQLLITPISKWPAAFESLQYLKYANGYNKFVNFTDFIAKEPIQKKFYFMGIKKFPIQNLNGSVIILVIFFAIFMTAIFISRIVEPSKNLKERKKQKKEKKRKLTFKQKCYLNVRKFIEIAYQPISQLSKWSILQLLSSFTAFLSISNKNISLVNQPPNSYLSIQNLLFLISFVIAITIGLNNFSSLYLDNLMFSKMKKKSQQLLYKRLLFIYLLLIGFLIFFFNQIRIFNISMSAIVLFIHLAFTFVINFYVRPYKNSLKIHRVILCFQHIQFSVFLLMINFINFSQNVSDIFMMLLGITININCSVTVIITVFRLYYQYRFGQQLQIKMKKKREQEEKLKIEQMINRIQKKSKLKQQNENALFNKFKNQNQIHQDQRYDYLDWIKQRDHLTTQQKETIFFQKYKQKPLEWIKKNQPKKYQQIIQSKQKKQKKQKQQKNKNNNRDQNQHQNLQKLMEKKKSDQQRIQKKKLKDEMLRLYNNKQKRLSKKIQK